MYERWTLGEQCLLGGRASARQIIWVRMGGPRKRCAPVIDFSEILSTKLNRSQLDPEHIYFWELEKRKLEEILRREVLSGQMWPTAVGIFW